MREENGAYYVEPEEYENLLEMLKAQQGAPTEEIVKAGETESPSQLEVSLYQLNQMMVSQMPDMDTEMMKENFVNWYQEHRASYFMLLCRELSYYTLFHLDWDGSHKTEKFWDELYETCQCAGHIKMIETDTNEALSIWITWSADEECHCFYLFPYDEGVVEV